MNEPQYLVAGPVENSPKRRRILVIFNPVAGGRRARARRYAAVLRHLRGAGEEITVRETQFRGDAEAYAVGIDGGAWDLLVVAGGDGTINEVVNGLGANPGPARTLPLAIIPLGTANVLALEIGLGLSPRRIARTILAGRSRPISLGQANGRRFLLMAGAGFDAHVVAGVDGAVKRRIGKGAYVLGTFKQFVRFRFAPLRVRVDGREWHGGSVVVANAHYYGGRFIVAPEADLESPSLEVRVFTGRTRWHAMLYAAAVAMGFLRALPSVVKESGRSVTIHGPREDPIQGDGDIIASLPVEIVVLPDALNLVFPESSGV